MSLPDDLLIILTSYSSGYALMRRRMRGDFGPSTKSGLRKRLDADNAALGVALARLKKRGLVMGEDGVWRLTEKGRNYIYKKIEAISGLKGVRLTHGQYEAARFKRPKNMIIAFDIPESLRGMRWWLRVELKLLGFALLQKSVWFGPAPLPKEFIESLHRSGALRHFKFFKASEYDIT